MGTAPTLEGPAPHRRPRAAPARRRQAAGVSLVVAVAGLVWFVVPDGSGADTGLEGGQPAAETTTTAPADPVTVYGCAITVPGGTEAAAPGEADPDCTDASVVAEYCGVPRASIATPGTERPVPGGLVRTYETVAGLPAGSVTHHDEGAGPTGVPVTLACASKRTFSFTAADVDAFTRPA